MAYEDKSKDLSRPTNFRLLVRFLRRSAVTYLYKRLSPRHWRGYAAVAFDGRVQKKCRDSDGNLVNVGNFDSDGVNVNNDRPGNSNDNLAVSFSRNLKFLCIFNPTA